MSGSLSPSPEAPTAEADLETAAARLEAGDPTGAVASLHLESGRQHLDASGWHLLVRALTGLGDHAERDVASSEAVAAFPGDLSLHVAHAESAMAREDWLAACQRWETIRQRFSRFPGGVYLRQARACLAREDYAAAAASVDLYLRANPASTAARELKHLIASRRARKYQLEVRGVSTEIECHLDGVAGRSLIGSREVFQRHRLQGWVAVAPGETVVLLLRSRTETQEQPLNVTRRDVRETYAARGRDVAEQCGFDVGVDVTSGLTLGFRIDGETHWCRELSIQPVIEILRGKDDWLFLANDSNASIDQFTGTRLLSDDERRRWQAFADWLAPLQARRSVLFLVANAKEKVVPERYPHAPGETTLTAQVERILAAAGVSYLNPLAAMQATSGSYYPTDTHWSDLGAFVAFQACMRAWGYSARFERCCHLWSQETMGDLGSKLSPPASAARPVIHFEGEDRVQRQFSNEINGTGHLTVYVNAQPRYRKCVVIFGGSSTFAGGFGRFFAALFKRVVVVNQPGSYIDEIVEHERADHVIIQTNERYLAAPGARFEHLLDSDIARLVHKLGESERQDLLARLRRYTGNDFYHTAMSEALMPSSAA